MAYSLKNIWQKRVSIFKSIRRNSGKKGISIDQIIKKRAFYNSSIKSIDRKCNNKYQKKHYKDKFSRDF